MLTFSCGQYRVVASISELPAAYYHYVKRAVLHECVGRRTGDGTDLFFAVGKSDDDWPELVVMLHYEPSSSSGFDPGFLLIPEHNLFYVGAGTSLLAYQLSPVRRLWQDFAVVGFWGWSRHDDVVLMAAELEFAAWDLNGRKLWSTFVEPEWSYEVRDGQVKLDVMGRKSTFDLVNGPPMPGSA